MLSPDGRWRWDGTEWKPEPQSRSQRFGSWLTTAKGRQERWVAVDGTMDQQIALMGAAGFQVTSRSDDLVQLLRPKVFGGVVALLWTIFTCGPGLVVYGIYYLAKRDEVVTLRATPEGVQRFNGVR